MSRKCRLSSRAKEFRIQQMNNFLTVLYIMKCAPVGPYMCLIKPACLSIAKRLAGSAAASTRRVQVSSRSPGKVHAALERDPEVDTARLLPAVSVDITQPHTLAPSFKGADVVVSLVGIMHGTPSDFERIQWKGAENVAHAAKDAGAKLIHFSAIGADANSSIPYARTKALAEKSVFEICPDATIIRPSLVLGPGDGFFNASCLSFTGRFSQLSRYLPFLPVFGGGTSRFQPVYSGDIARAVEIIARDDRDIRKAVAGKIVEAGGPDMFTYREMMELVLKYNHRRRPIISLPFAVGMMQGFVLEQLPLNLFTVTRAQIEQLKSDNVISGPGASSTANYLSFKDLVESNSQDPLQTVHDILPTYLSRTCCPYFSDVNTPRSLVASRSRTIMSEKYDETISPTTPNDTPVTSTPQPPSGKEQEVEEKKKPYSIYSTREKWSIVMLTSFAALFSPLTANIYLPAIPTMAAAFHKSTELINITVTVYMVFQGLSPMFWGTMADKVGRRPVFLACLIVLSLACAAGSASTVALGAGVIGDIAEPFERGGFFGISSLGPMVGPFLPETLRALVGDGSYVPSAIYRPLLPIIGRNRPVAENVEKPPKKPFANPLVLFTYPDVMVILVFNGIVYSVFYGVTATISVLFQQAYPYLSESDIGLCFLAIGGGMIMGSAVVGKLLDRDYAAFKARMIKKIKEGSNETGMRPEDVTKEENFPIELARLRTMPIYLGIFCAATIGYGWCLQARVSIAVPLVLHICMGFVLTAVMNTSQTLLVDLVPLQGSSITACVCLFSALLFQVLLTPPQNNFVRCLLGAGLVAIINIITDALKPGWTYVLLGGVCALTTPMLFLSMHIGPKCRAKRRHAKALRAN
ncbi:hypothetical protein HWV62_42510 [Athelia sp. TMB]|nr:hypothetical protein HWV62_42510 [Athelia sp. TMB]